MSVNALDNNLSSALLMSAKLFKTFPDFCQKLLALGADPNCINKQGESFITRVRYMNENKPSQIE